MISHRDDRGYQPGSGVIDRSHQRFILHIPKNASSFISHWTTRSGQWHVHTLTDCQDHDDLQQMIIVLRDPVERWLSGFAQYACSWLLNASRFFDTATGPGQNFQRRTGQEFVQHYNWMTERLIFDNVEIFDDHVWPQSCFFRDILPDVPRRFFVLDHDFDHRFAQYLDLPAPDPDLDRNIGDANPDVRQIRQFLKSRMQDVPELLRCVKQVYEQDYHLIDSLR